MALSKKRESALLCVYEAYWDHYLKGEVAAIPPLLDASYTQVGSAESEVFSTKKDAVTFLRDTIDQVAGKLEMRNRSTQLEKQGDLVLIHELCDLYALDGKKWIFYSKFRATTLMSETKTGWKITHQHSSFPDTKTEAGQNVAIEKIAAENQQLREAVRRRTQELEGKNRELEIEAALERVRSRAMAMHKSEELREVVAVIYEQMRPLGFATLGCELILCDDKSKELQYWSSTPEQSLLPECYPIPRNQHPFFKKAWNAWKKQTPRFVFAIKGLEKRKFDDLIFKKTAFKNMPEKVKDWIRSGKSDVFSLVTTKFGLLEAVDTKPLSEEKFQVLERFAKVFDQTYTRFLDLQQAEVQTREAQIQLSLERVRAKSMAMQSSDELSEVLSILFQQFDVLGIKPVHVWLSLFHEKENTFTYRSTGTGGARILFQQAIPIDAMDIWSEALKQWKSGKGEPVLVTFYPKEVVPIALEVFNETFMAMPEEERIVSSTFPDGFFNVQGYCKFGYLGFNHFREPTDEEKDILRKFAKEFERVYQRFLDIQKAEAQTREAKLEAALERVRGSAMAMHSSKDLQKVAEELRKQIGQLDYKDLETCAIHLYDESPDYFVSWAAQLSPGSKSDIVLGHNHFPKSGVEIFDEMFQAYNSGKKDYVLINDGKKMTGFLKMLKQYAPQGHQVVLNTFKGFKRTDYRSFWSISDFVGGSLVMTTVNKPDDLTRDLLRRFANVFGMAYRRFTDLQKAEAQAREAQIEASLERIRSKTMAMHKSDELSEVATLLLDQIKLLGAELWTTVIAICRDKELLVEKWTGSPILGEMFDPIFIPYDADHGEQSMYDTWKNQVDLYSYVQDGKELSDIYEHLMSIPTFKDTFQRVIDSGRPLPVWQKNHVVSYKYGYLLIITTQEFQEERVFIRFAKVFEQAYIRFIDLQKAEAQAREAQIEASLERIRSRSMAMHKSEELLDVGSLLYHELLKFDISNLTSGYCLMDADEKMGWNYLANQIDGAVLPKPMGIPHQETKVMRSIVKSWKKQDPFHSINLNEAETIVHQTFIAERTINFNMTAKELIALTPKELTLQTFNFKHGYLLIVGAEPLSREQTDMLVRFAKVFEQTYTRFLDLQKAEAQAREAQIEAALEKVRSRSLAMHKSDELKDVILEVLKKLQELGIAMENRATAIITYEKESKDYYQWAASPEYKAIISFLTPYIDHPVQNDIWNARQTGTDFYAKSYTVQEKNSLYKYFFEHTVLKSIMPEEDKKKALGFKHYDVAIAFEKNSAILLVSHSGKQLTESESAILKRFAKVFEQSYTRFLDLQKAEAQAREAEIQLALERVRARTMAMQKSDELSEVASIMFKKIQELGTQQWTSGFEIWLPDQISSTAWVSKPDGSIAEPMTIPFNEDPYFKTILEARQSGQSFLVFESSGESLENTYKYMSNFSSSKKFFEESEDLGFQIPTFQITHCVFFSFGFLIFITYEPVPEMWDIFKRFAKVFEQTYTRFLDLQKAEAQAKEAEIQLALERVRARAMAMQKSDELAEVSVVLFEELGKIGIKDFVNCGFNEIDEEKRTQIGWPTLIDGSKAERYHLPLTGDEILDERNERRKAGVPYLSKSVGGIKLKKHLEFIFKTLESKQIEELVKENFPDPTVFTQFFYNHGYLDFSSREPFSNEEVTVLIRCAKAFEQAYIRFIDLQKAEAQAREAQIEAALERVRSKTMAMHNSHDVGVTVVSLFDEVSKLGLDDTIRCGIGILEGTEKMETWSTKANSDGDVDLKVGFLDMTIHPLLIGVKKAWKEHKERYSYELKGAAVRRYYGALNKEPDYPFNADLDTLPKREYNTIFPFTAGVLFAFTENPITEEAARVLYRFAGVFGQTYRRYLDLQKAEAQAREAQIEASLERVRAASMAMHQTEDIGKVVVVFFGQLKQLNIPFEQAWITILHLDEGYFDTWFSPIDGIYNEPKHFKMPSAPFEETAIKPWKAGVPFSYLSLKTKEEVDQFLFACDAMTDSKYFSHVQKILKNERLEFLEARHNYGFVSKITKDDPTKEDEELLQRFGKVFEQTYTRFLDLQKAETQAREAQIEAALEKVRSRSLAMQKSDELQEVVRVVAEKITELGVVLEIGGVVICTYPIEGEKDQIHWTASFDPLLPSVPYYLPYFDTPLSVEAFAAKLNGDEYFEKILTKEENLHFFNLALVHSDYKNLPDAYKTALLACDHHGFSFAIQKNSALMVASIEGKLLNEAHKSILIRFSKVFEQAYIRFMDLQKAEAQAREAQIEMALERIRSRSMAMHSSNELSDVLKVLFDQFVILEINPVFAVLNLYDLDNDTFTMRATGKNGAKVFATQTVKFSENEIWKDYGEKFRQGNPDIINDQFYPVEILPNVWEILKELVHAIPEEVRPLPSDFPNGLYNIEGYCKYGTIGCNLNRPPTDEEKNIVIKFATEFGRLYQRFLDIEKAEAQAREAQIEAALEKVRSRSLAMNTADELQEVVTVVGEKLQELGVILDSGGVVICTYFPDSKDVMHWTATFDSSFPSVPYFLPYFDTPIFIETWDSKNSGTDFFEKNYSFEDKNHFFHYAFEHSDYKNLPAEYKQALLDAESHALSFAWAKNSALMIASHTGMLLPDEHKIILKRFAKVFEQAYIRFMDLQKAEAQAKEAQIETALEKVRSRSLAMHNSKELQQVVNVVYDQLKELGLQSHAVAMSGVIKPRSAYEVWVGGSTFSEPLVIPYTDSTQVQREYNEVIEGRPELFCKTFSGEIMKEYFNFLMQENVFPDEIEKLMLECEAFSTTLTFAKNSGMQLVRYSAEPYTDTENKLLIRFQNVFEQAYVRFMDLQKAEAQARESQIETALERVRARSMAMQSSTELHEILGVLFRQFDNLGIKPVNVFLSLFNRENRTLTYRASGKSGTRIPGKQVVEVDSMGALKALFDKWCTDNSDSVEVLHYPKEVLPQLFGIFAETFAAMPEEDRMGVDDFPDGGYSMAGYTPFGYLGYDHQRPATEEEKDILSRFCIEFTRVYQRFLDIQKAEAQAREAQIEAALERIRGRSMAMHSSEELNDVLKVMFQQVEVLGIDAKCAHLTLMDLENNTFSFRITGKNGAANMGEQIIDLNAMPVWKETVSNWKKAKPHSHQCLVYPPEILPDLWKLIHTSLKSLPARERIKISDFPNGVFDCEGHNKFGYIGFNNSRPPTEEEISIVIRFALEFERVYQRFLEIKKAEAQAREAQIEMALERVRARSMAMHQTDELSDVLCVLFEQFDFLEINPVLTHLTLMDEANETFTLRITTSPKERVFAEQKIDINAVESWKASFENWKKGAPNTVDCIDYPPEVLPYVWEVLSEVMTALPEGHKINPEDFPDGLYTTQGHFKFGYLGFNHSRRATEEEKNIVSRFATEFGRVYQRFLDIQKAEAQAKESEIQLALERVRARTMAMHNSNELGEVASVLFEQISFLTNTPDRFNIAIANEKDRTYDVWVTDQQGHKISKLFVAAANKSPVIFEAFEAWKRKEDFNVQDLYGERLEDWLQYMGKEVGIPFEKSQVKDHRYINNVFFSHGFIGITTNEPPDPETLKLIGRFAKVFQQTYTRFLDLQKAEAQAREAQIQLSLERVRAKAMAMRESEELTEVLPIIFEQLDGLGVRAIWTHLTLIDLKKNTFTYRMTGREGKRVYAEQVVDLDASDIWKDAAETFKSEKPDAIARFYFPSESLPGIWEIFDGIFSTLPEGYKIHQEDFPGGIFTTQANCEFGYIGINNTEKATVEEENILLRFAKEFGRLYQRFLDLQKAEAQSRESQIEASLERIRAKAMAMQHTEELNEVIGLLCEQYDILGIDPVCAHLSLVDLENDRFSLRLTGKKGARNVGEQIIDANTMPVWAEAIEKWKTAEPLSHQCLVYPPAQVPVLMEILDGVISTMPEEARIRAADFPNGLFSCEGQNKFGNLGFNHSRPPTEEEIQIVIRFAREFERIYQRFLDLEKAEDQAREAKIEASLERVRAQTMAMHSSEDVATAVQTMFEELTHLGLDQRSRCGIGILDSSDFMELWTASKDQHGKSMIHIGKIDMSLHPLLLAAKKAWNDRKSQYNYSLEGVEVKNYFKIINSSREYTFKVDLKKLPSKIYHSDFVFPEGIIFSFTQEPVSNELAHILERFTKQFGLTYRRYLDLVKAEAQAREAQIEASLERLRSRSMAMQHSSELNLILTKVFEELTLLDLEMERAVIWTYNPEDRSVRWWAANPEAESGTESYFIGDCNDPVYNEYWKAWEERRTKYLYILEGAYKENWTDILFNKTELGRLPEIVKEAMVRPERIFLYNTFNEFGVLFIACLGPIPDEKFTILERFGKVFDQSYTRFNDIKQAEFREKEAIKQSSLDRVRGQIASMRSTTDLDRITPLVWNELTTLGIPFIRCGVFIIDEATQTEKAYLSAPNGDSLGVLNLPFKASTLTADSVTFWRKKKVLHQHWNKEEFVSWTESLMEQGLLENKATYQGTSQPPESLDLHFIPFDQGMLYVGSKAALPDFQIDLVQALANAFSVAYARYEDFVQLEKAKESVENTLVELKATQNQLVQSEKMASLGELTAGIAHEIQNPLNFVNNFSEVSKELLEEMMEEMAKGDVEEVKAIAEDVIQNLEKIVHHGKRADGIVKGMLQHSRNSSGTKEPTDINVLADEYLRLAYHGLRAKDKAFNATLKTHFDHTLGKVNVVPQDIGRVILNLIMNAFYVVKEKKEHLQNGFEPTVTIRTKKHKDLITISIQDNGNGIQKNVLDKIFQPFFTTKPTGEGTGLGLSMSYDIITKGHGGDLKVETKEGEGSEFTISLPLND